MKAKTLRFKITLVAGIIIVLTCGILTVNSILSAKYYYNELGNGPAEIMLDIPQELSEVNGSEYRAYEILEKNFSIQSIAVMSAAMIMALFLIYYFTGKALAPLADLTKKIKAVNEKNLHETVEVKKTSAEVVQLMQTYNNMLIRLEDAFANQKQFAANAAHELKTPLTVMKTSMQVLRMDETPTMEDYREFVSDTEQSLDRLIQTVTGLMSLADDSIRSAEYEEINLKELCEQAASELKQLAEDNGVTVNTPGNSAVILNDKTMLYRIIYNLMENAIKYNKPDGSVSITLTESQDGPFISVADTGIGMDDNTISKIFAPFYRADESRSQDIPGAGLGLSIVKLMTEKCGGQIDIHSKPGSGTMITVKFSVS